MPRACVLLAPGFEEIEAITIIDVLRRAEVDTVAAAVKDNPVRGSHGILVHADVGLTDVTQASWDVVVLPGGMPGSATLRDDEAVQALLRRQYDGGGRVAAICAAPIALAKAGLLAGRKATSYPGFREQLACDYVEDAVVSDGRIVTSRGPGTALPFALELVAQVVSRRAADELAERMLTR
jgi:4-methyl-5(b-hydroxyethyl)-thiazole monophosphate biosynthesis